MRSNYKFFTEHNGETDEEKNPYNDCCFWLC